MFQNVILSVLTFQLCTAYVLVSVSKNENNQSDVKAYVHKVLPSLDVEKEGEDHEIERRFQDDTPKVRRFEIKKRADEDVDLRRRQTVTWISQALETLINMARGPEFRSSKTMSFIDRALDLAKAYINGPEFRSSKTMKYLEKVIDIMKEAAVGPRYRSGKKASPNMRTEIVHLQGDHPSLVFELKPNFFVDFVKKILSAQLVEKYMDEMGISNLETPNYQQPTRNLNYKKRYPSNYNKFVRQ